jgi:hypothetical protein
MTIGLVLLCLLAYFGTFATAGALIGLFVPFGGPWSGIGDNVLLGVRVGLFTAVGWPFAIPIALWGVFRG